MKPFESFWAQNLTDYIAYRQSLNYSNGSLKLHLHYLDRYLKINAPFEMFLTPSFLLEFRNSLNGDPRTVNSILASVRGFFQFMVRKNYYDENPMQDIPNLKEYAYIPFIFSSVQIDKLLDSICKKIRKTEAHFLKDFSVYMAIMLMARCGLRISEPLSLLQHHYRPDEGTLYIEKTKFKKDRLIPVPKRVMSQIENFLLVRKTLLGDNQNPYMLPGHKKNRLSDNRIYLIFHKTLKDLGIDQPRRKIGNIIFGAPRPHSLRHFFAVHTLERIKFRGESPQKALPYLSAYLGHRKYRYTVLYLKVLDAKQRQELVDFNIRELEDI